MININAHRKIALVAYWVLMFFALFESMQLLIPIEVRVYVLFPIIRLSVMYLCALNIFTGLSSFEYQER